MDFDNYLLLPRSPRSNRDLERIGTYASLPFVIDPMVPPGEVLVVQNGRVVVRIINAFGT